MYEIKWESLEYQTWAKWENLEQEFKGVSFIIPEFAQIHVYDAI